MENLTCRVSVSKAKEFALVRFPRSVKKKPNPTLLSLHLSLSQVDLIDSPGLVDGDVSYPFDVNKAIEFMADHVDMMLVFMDPTGQALCTRTMNVVKMLNEKHYAKLKYFLTKVIEVCS